MLPDGISYMFSSLISGVLSEYIGIKVISLIGLLISTGGAFGLYTLDASTSIALIELFLGLIGFGQGLFTSPMAKAVMKSVEFKDRGSTYSTNVLFSSFFRMISIIAVFMSLFSKLNTSQVLDIFFKGSIQIHLIELFLSGFVLCIWLGIGSFIITFIITIFYENDLKNTWNSRHQENNEPTEMNELEANI